MSTKPRQILVTSALPYANGSIHLGHLVEYIQTDIWARFQRLIGNECYYMCADDTHGTPIMLSAKRQGVTPEVLIEKMHAEHTADFKAFDILFDDYYSTNSPENRTFSEFIYLEAKKKGAIFEKEIKQLFCEKCGIFLPDRFIRGTCPVCKAPDQYGDACEQCAAAYTPAELIAPRCAECGASPALKPTTHHFFKLSLFVDELKKWTAGGHVQEEIANKLEEWYLQGLRDWDISRDAPYFGFRIPGTEDKYFYVWLDAPVGYMATTKHWCGLKGRSFDEIWRRGDFEIHHVIGKDILYFHTLFWPAMLMASGFKLPAKVHVHGFLTVNGEKMSKSRGTFINARDYLGQYDPEYLRYYYASKLSSAIDDVDLNWEDFIFKVNSDIVNKVVNIASRLGSIVTKKLGGRLTGMDAEGEALLERLRALEKPVSAAFEAFEFSQAMKLIIAGADEANRYIDTKAPWSLAEPDPAQAARVCTSGLNALRILMIYLKPVIPIIARGVESFLGIPELTWSDLTRPLIDHPIHPYEHLAKRLDPKKDLPKFGRFQVEGGR